MQQFSAKMKNQAFAFYLGTHLDKSFGMPLTNTLRKLKLFRWRHSHKEWLWFFVFWNFRNDFHIIENNFETLPSIEKRQEYVIISNERENISIFLFIFVRLMILEVLEDEAAWTVEKGCLRYTSKWNFWRKVNLNICIFI